MHSGFPSFVIRLGVGYVFVWVGMHMVFQGYIPPARQQLVTLVPLQAVAVPQLALYTGIGSMALGIVLLLGLFTRFFAVLGSAAFLVVIGTLLWSTEFNEVWFVIAFAMMSMSLIALGGGGMSIDGALSRHEDI